MSASGHDGAPQPNAVGKRDSSRMVVRTDEPLERHTYRLRPIALASSTPAAFEIARLSTLSETLIQLQRLLVRQAPRLAIKTQRRILFVSPAEVVAVEAKGNYVLLQLQTKSYLLRDAISAMADKLQPYGFVRIHRSVLINSSWVREIEPQPTGEYLVRTQDNREYAATRTYLRNLKSLAESWIGPVAFLAQGS